jgi:hypothetical protein
MAEQLTQQDLSVLDKFRNAALQMRDAFTRLVSLQSYAASRPDLRAEYDDLFSEGETIKKTVQYITSTVDSVTGFFSDAWGSASAAAKRFFGLGVIMQPEPGLGIVPIVGVAAIAGSIAIMGKWVRDVYLFERKVAEQKRLEGEGLSPQEAAQQLQHLDTSGSLFGDAFGNLAMPALIIGGGFLVWQFLKSRRA